MKADQMVQSAVACSFVLQGISFYPEGAYDARVAAWGFPFYDDLVEPPPYPVPVPVPDPMPTPAPNPPATHIWLPEEGELAPNNWKPLE